MGCTNSKQATTTAASRPTETSHKTNPLSEKEIAARIEAPKETLSLELAGVKYRLAYVSQRGYYPESPDKDNQDAFTVNTSFGNPADQQAFFAVYDGHGKDGHYCARFARDQLSRSILDKFSRVPAGGMNSKSIRQALSAAHANTNDQMHADKRFDDSLSGTTAISILLRGRMMYVSNVGDSRAIVVSLTDANDGGGTTHRLVAKPLSSDQTPYRKDERERIKKYGSRILSMDQIEGVEPIHENWGDLNLGEDIDEGGDPPRVWSQHGNYPGTAFTRSLGDMIAEECGVIAEPEILEREIHPQDKYIVVASDGVFEFLTNQMVADILTRYTDPLAACKAVVQTAYEMWLQYEVRTDDISIIALYLDEVPTSTTFDLSSSFYYAGPASAPAPVPSAAAATASAAAAAVGEEKSSAAVSAASPVPTAAAASSSDAGMSAVESLEARPVRRALSREKRKNLIALRDEEEDAEPPLSEAQLAALVLPKSDAHEKTILSAMKSNFLFQHLNASQRQTVVGLMRPVQIHAGEWVIRQGDAGDKFYIVDSGRLEVRVKSWAFPTENDVHSHMSEEEKERVGGACVHVYESGPEQHPGFGELSLMYGKPRAASVIALTDGLLWALDRRVFKRVVLRPRDMRREVIRILKKVELLKCLNVTQLQRLTDLLNEREFPAGSNIITQGEEGTTFYILVAGFAECSINAPPGELDADGKPAPPKVVMQLHEYDYFGERALLESKPRAANVVAVNDCKVLYIEKAAFEEVLGPLAQIIAEDRARREAIAAQALTAPRSLDDLQLSGVVLTDPLGALLLGSWGGAAPGAARVAVTVRSLVATETAKSSSNDSAARFLEVAKLLRTTTTGAAAAPHGASGAAAAFLLPSSLGLFKQSNAVHIVFNAPVVADLATFIRTYSARLSDPANGSASNGSASNGSASNGSTATVGVPAYLVHSVACIASALERLHELHVVYRAIQPESLYVDSRGNVVLLDFRFAKIGLAPPSSGSGDSGGGGGGAGDAAAGNAGKAFTICGASDYLSPEQIAQTGHGYPVDLWGLGVLLYELAVGSHPFSCSTEVATYSKIASFGSKAFPALKFPDTVHPEVRALVNQLLVPTPEARIGIAQLKRHAFFASAAPIGATSPGGGSGTTAFWSALSSGEMMSPLLALAVQEQSDVAREGVDQSLLDSFVSVCDAPPQWMSLVE